MEERNNNRAKLKKVLRIVGDVLVFVLVAIALFAVVLSIVSKKDSDGTATLFGVQLRFVQSSSMEKCDQTDVSAYKIKSIPIRSCVFVQVVPEKDLEAQRWYDNVKVGDVLTIKYTYQRQETITHRVVDIKPNEKGGYIITLQGDNKPTDGSVLQQQVIDTSASFNVSSADSRSFNYVVGKVVGQSYLLGLLVYAFKTPVGLVCMVIIPCLIIIVFEVLRLTRVLNADKKQKLQAQQQQQADEIENLKRQLAELQNASQQSAQTELPSDETDVK